MTPTDRQPSGVEPARIPDPPTDHAPPSARLSQDDEDAALRSQSVGRLAFVVDGWPIVVPVNFVLDGRDIVFRTDPGTKLAACRSAQVTFQVDSLDRLYQSGWSVLVFGIADEVRARADLERVEQLALRSWAKGAKAHWVRISVRQVSSRVLPKAWSYPSRLP